MDTLFFLMALGLFTLPIYSIPSRNFGIGISQGTISATESEIFAYTLSPGATTGVITHVWVTGGDDQDVDNYIFRYYLDGETTASIQFTMAMMCGCFTFNKTATYHKAPWNALFFGKGSENGGWFSNLRIPFGKSIIVTTQLPANRAPGNTQRYFVQVRGVEDLPIVVGGVTLPPTARIVQQRLGPVDGTAGAGVLLQPLQYVDLVSIPAPASGVFLFSVLAVESGSDNFMEGCFHAYNPTGADFPGELLATGTEDYYNSAYYFSAGPFVMPETGLTVRSDAVEFGMNGTTSPVYWTAYRVHESDPQFFSGGYRLQWRNGDSSNAGGFKCLCNDTVGACGTPVGRPTASSIWHYGWAYVF